jgi:hydrogenase expression/formation protein HypE
MNESREVLLAHGGGGTLMHDLIKSVVASGLSNPVLDRLDDSALLDADGKLAFTTDSYVVRPLFFKGGDIGKLAVCGTVNDLAMQGSKPLAISLSFILEEGFPISDLKKIVKSVASTAKAAGVFVATGDLKVVEKGGADKLFVNTSGIGSVRRDINVSSHNAKKGDVVIINGHIADHGVSILCEREGLEFESPVKSDCAPLAGLIQEIIKTSKRVHCMKDPTRGGLAAALNEVASNSGVGIEIEEPAIPVRRTTLAACEMLGLDPLVVANEGKVVVICPETIASTILSKMRKHKYGRASKVIGRIADRGKPEVVLKTAIGGSRIVDMPYGELLPRIC